MEHHTDNYVADIFQYHCPRWDELPEIELYIDQVTIFLSKNLQLFHSNTETPFLTASMINNYVKQGILERPNKKKYGRSHLAHLFVICIMKRLFSISDIGDAIASMKKTYAVKDGYNLFCDELETALQRAFGAQPFPLTITECDDSRSVAALKAITQAFASLILAEHLVSLRQTEQNTEPSL